MRFILIHRFGILQTKTQRIDVNFCQGTTQLLQYLQKRVGRPCRDFIVRVKRGRSSYRLIKGWPLTTYTLREGSQLYIEVLEEVVKNTQHPNINARYLHALLGPRHGMMEQIQQQHQHQIQQDDTLTVRKYLDSQCEKMLGLIQKGQLKAFLQVFQQVPVQFQEEKIQQIQSMIPQLIDELGEKGWGALHYSIFYKAIDIFDELIQMEVDVNKCTSDGWLPIQLATNIKQLYFVDRLLAHPNLSLNLITSRGSPMHVAAREANVQILKRFLQKDFDINLKDNLGKTIIQVCTDDHCLALLRKYEEKKESYQSYVKGGVPLSLATIIKGTILKAKRPFMQLKERYLLIDPFQGSLLRFASLEDYPKKPIEITPLNILGGFKAIQNEDKAWYMKDNLFYFQIERPNKEIYACKFKETVQTWLRSIKTAIKFAEELQKNPQMISQVKRNQVLIEDKPPQIQSPKKVKRNVFDLTQSSKLSRGESVTPQRITVVTSAQTRIQSPVKQQPLLTYKQQVEVIKNTNEIFTKQLKLIQSNKISFASFSIIETLGVGAFGKVFLARFISTGKLYALKALKKKNLIMQKQLKYAVVQANILKSANHPFIINLHFAFQTPHYLYLVLDYCPGRDLSFHLAREVTFPEDEARYYVAQLCLALEHLHSKNILYRDLKPQNVLLDARGDIRLTDFGLSKQTADERTKSFCGSPAYLSPEMLAQKGACKESDFYGLGAMLYQFLVGESPYFSEDLPTLYQKIKEQKLKFSKSVGQVAKSLIAGLMERDPKKRLGSGGTSQIKNHPFFNGFDWKALVQLKLTPPIRPEVENNEDDEDEHLILKQRNNFADFDYEESTKKINRLMNFSFQRKTLL